MSPQCAPIPNRVGKQAAAESGESRVPSAPAAAGWHDGAESSAAEPQAARFDGSASASGAQRRGHLCHSQYELSPH